MRISDWSSDVCSSDLKAELEMLVRRTREVFDRIDVLVCNAASNPYYGPMAGISDDQFRKIFDNNVLANNWLISMVAPEMIARSEERREGKEGVSTCNSRGSPCH